MLRRILACFMLLTGLAAIGAPAEARMSAIAAQSVLDGSGGSAQPSQPAPCVQASQRQNLQAKPANTVGCRPRKPVVIYVPTVQLGPDRARE